MELTEKENELIEMVRSFETIVGQWLGHKIG